MGQKTEKITLAQYCRENGKEYLLKEWDQEKNGNLTPENVTAGSGKKVWWHKLCHNETTGQNSDISWMAIIQNRVNGAGSPLPFKQTEKDFNDLATTHPELAAQWHPVRNKDLKPEDVSAGSSKKVWWLMPYDDKKTGKHFDFEWIAAVAQRAKGSSCPFTSGQAVWKGFNDLATTHPKLAAQWHPVRNKDLKPEDVSAGSNKKVWWLMPYDDKKTGRHFDFEWDASVAGRVKSPGCPYLSNRKVWKGFNDLATTHPKLAAQWHPVRNKDLKPEDVSAGSSKKVWWKITDRDVCKIVYVMAKSHES